MLEVLDKGLFARQRTNSKGHLVPGALSLLF